MARGKKAETKAGGGDGDGGGKVKPSEVRPAISAKKLKDLITTARAAKADTQAISGTLGAEIKAAIENNHLDRKAFNVCRTADRMESERLAEFLDNLDHYMDISGLRDRAAKVQRMDLGDGRGGDGKEVEETDEPEPARGRASGLRSAGNVRPFPSPVGEAAE